MTNCLRKSLVVILILLGVAGSTLAIPTDNKDDSDVTTTISKVIEYYNKGLISDAEQYALQALDSPDKLSRFERFTLHKILAFCFIASGNDVNAIVQFREALKLNSAMKPDPITWSPKVRDLFEVAKTEHDRELVINSYYQLTLEADLGRQASLKSLYLPGSGQSMKGHNSGIWITALFVGAAATFVYTQVAIPAARERYEEATELDDINHQWNGYTNLYHTAHVSGVMAGSIYIYAFFDALWTKPAISVTKPQP
jgi:hypothetical protein